MESHYPSEKLSLHFNYIYHSPPWWKYQWVSLIQTNRLTECYIIVSCSFSAVRSSDSLFLTGFRTRICVLIDLKQHSRHYLSLLLMSFVSLLTVAPTPAAWHRKERTGVFHLERVKKYDQVYSHCFLSALVFTSAFLRAFVSVRQGGIVFQM